MRRGFLIVGVFACCATAVFAQPLESAWKPMDRSPISAYQVTGMGDPLSATGATLQITAARVDDHPFGSVSQDVDAAAFRGHRITLSATLSVRDAVQGAQLWLRADGPEHGPDHKRASLAFGNSPLLKNVANGQVDSAFRQASLDVPKEASRLFFGLILKGKGDVTASKLRLVTGEPVVEVPPQKLLNQAISLVRTHALHSAELNWSVVEPQIRAMAADAVVARDVYPAIRELLKRLNDHHSFLMEPAHAANEASSVTLSTEPVVALHGGGVGYIDVPGYTGFDPHARDVFVTRMVDAIAGIAPEARCGWIVDLRQNTGGSMVPMLGGLRPLLGNTLGIGFRDAHGKVQRPLVGHGLDASDPHGPDLSKNAVAVLTGPKTASSGEVVAIAFRGRPNTRSFGSATHGLSTGNVVYPLADGSLLVLTTSVDVDRNGKAYGDKLEPDQVVTTPPDAGADSVMNAAAAWLAGQPSCHH